MTERNFHSSAANVPIAGRSVAEHFPRKRHEAGVAQYDANR
jgi:hypothetical protein